MTKCILEWTYKNIRYSGTAELISLNRTQFYRIYFRPFGINDEKSIELEFDSDAWKQTGDSKDEGQAEADLIFTISNKLISNYGFQE